MLPNLICSIVDELCLVLVLSVDTFAVSLVYGSHKVKIPWYINLMMNTMATSLLVGAILLGVTCKEYVPLEVANWICFSILFGIGLYKCLEGMKEGHENKVEFQEKKRFSLKEAFFLSVALSLDGMCAGFGAGFMEIQVGIIVCVSLCIGFGAVFFGSYCGRKLVEYTSFNYAIIGGLCMICLAFTKIGH